MRPSAQIRASALLVCAVLSLTGCGSDSSTAEPSATRAASPSTSATPSTPTTADEAAQGRELVDVGAHALSADCPDAGEGPTVVFLHGLGGRGADWGPTARVLGGVRSCTYDRLNVGGSDSDEGRHTALDSVEDLHALLDQVGEPPFILVAHSYGGLIAEMYAATYRDEVAGLVLADSTLTLETSLDPPSSVDDVRQDMDSNGENLDAYEGYAQARALEPRLPDIPIHYILAEQGELPVEWDADAYDRRLRAWIRALPQGQLLRCSCPHEIPAAVPGVLADQVRAVIAEASQARR